MRRRTIKDRKAKPNFRKRRLVRNIEDEDERDMSGIDAGMVDKDGK